MSISAKGELYESHIFCHWQNKGGSADWEAGAKRGFLTKVYAILSLQLAFTVATCYLCM